MAEHAVQSAAMAHDEVTQHAPITNPLNVVVESQNGGRLVYKFVDEASGQVIQQIPSEAMIRMAEAINSILQDMISKQTRLK